MYAKRVIGRLLPLIALWFALGCSLTANAPESRQGAVVGMFEIKVISWGDTFSGLHDNGIELYLTNTLTGQEYKTEVENGFFHFDDLPKGNYRLYRAVMSKQNLNLDIELFQFIVVLDSYISILRRKLHYQGIRLRSFNEKGINNKTVTVNYPPGQPFAYIEKTYEGEKENEYKTMVY